MCRGLLCAVALVLGASIANGYAVEFLCETPTGELGGCFSSCQDVEEFRGLLTVRDSDRDRADLCRNGYVCCPLPISSSGQAHNAKFYDDSTEVNSAGCGREFSHQFRILQGKRSVQGSHPWLVAIFLFNSFICGGSLITNQYVLTAAHCFSPDEQKTPLLKRSYFAFLGTTSLTDISNRRSRRFCRVSIHEHFVKSNFHNDIAIAELNDPVDISGKWIRTICLPLYSSPKAEDVSGREYTMAGWGSVRADKTVLPLRLMEIQITGSSNEACREQFSQYLRVDSALQLCAGDMARNERDACQGDSGSPLTHLGPDGRYRVEGITSFGVGCALKGMPLGGYARVHHFVPWIISVLNYMKATTQTCNFVEIDDVG